MTDFEVCIKCHKCDSNKTSKVIVSLVQDIVNVTYMLIQRLYVNVCQANILSLAN